MTPEELKTVLEKHSLWLRGEPGGERADLSYSNLSCANLSHANLSGANIPLYSKWDVSTRDGQIQIGCKLMSIDDWDAWFAGDEVFETPRGTEEFRRIEAHYLAARAYLTHMSKDTKE